MILCSAGCNSVSVQHVEIYTKVNLNLPQVKAIFDEIQKLQSPRVKSKNLALRRKENLFRNLCHQKGCMNSGEVNITKALLLQIAGMLIFIKLDNTQEGSWLYLSN